MQPSQGSLLDALLDEKNRLQDELGDLRSRAFDEERSRRLERELQGVKFDLKKVLLNASFRCVE